MTDHLPALIAAGRAASVGATEGPWDGGPLGQIYGDGNKPVAIATNPRNTRHIAAHPPEVTRALWDAVEAAARWRSTLDSPSISASIQACAEFEAALARLRALAEAGR